MRYTPISKSGLPDSKVPMIPSHQPRNVDLALVEPGVPRVGVDRSTYIEVDRVSAISLKLVVFAEAR